MKTYFTLLIGCLVFFSCSDDNENSIWIIKDKEKAFQALIGKWQFKRIGLDAEFKNTSYLKKPECLQGSHLELRNNGTYKDVVRFLENNWPKNDSINEGRFEITDNWDNEIREKVTKIVFYNNTQTECVHFAPDLGSDVGILYSYTDTTFVVYDYYFDYQYGGIKLQYIEMQRIK